MAAVVRTDIKVEVILILVSHTYNDHIIYSVQKKRPDRLLVSSRLGSYLDLFSVAPNSTPRPRHVNSQLVSPQPVGILNSLCYIWNICSLFTVSPISTYSAKYTSHLNKIIIIIITNCPNMEDTKTGSYTILILTEFADFVAPWTIHQWAGLFHFLLKTCKNKAIVV